MAAAPAACKSADTIGANPYYYTLNRASGSNLVMVWPSCQPYLESWAHKLLGVCPRKFLKIRCPNMLFLAHFHY